MSVVPTISRAAFGTLADGTAIEAYALANGLGLEARILTFGGTLQSLRVPDAKGDAADLVLGFDSIDRYEGEHPYFGGLIGRYGNRIARGRFLLDGREHVLHCNNGPNHLHGGARGFDRVVWSAEPELTSEEARLHLRYRSADGEEGYPGALACVVVYAITRANELRIHYEARTDRPTLVNLTHHSYFNLSGHPRNGIREHHLSVDAAAYLPVDPALIPLGEARSVAGTPFDLRTPVTLDERLDSVDSQLQIGRGFDHNFVLNGWNADAREPRRCASLHDPVSGRTMDVLTTEPGLQVYTGGFLDGSIDGKQGVPYQQHAGLCLETQHFPDSPNHAEYPTTRLDPGQVYRSTTVYRFTAGTESGNR